MTVPLPPSLPSLAALLPRLVTLAEAAGVAIETCRRSGVLEVRAKGDGSPVGRADTEASSPPGCTRSRRMCPS